MRRLVAVRGEGDAREVCRRIGRLVEDPNLRGYAAVVPGATRHVAHVVRGALQRGRVLVLEGGSGCALVGDAFALFSAGRELAALDLAAVKSLGAWLVDAASNVDGRPAPLRLGDTTFDWARPVVMGVVNVTPDSFSDGGRFFDPERAITHGLALAAEGADLLDVGGESTRPRGAAYGDGAQTVSVEEELRRVVPVVRGLREKTGVPISIDTRKSEVAEAALAAGATLVNDVTGLVHDPRVADVAARAGAALCLQHVPADIEALTHETGTDDVLGDVLAGLERSIALAESKGVPRDRLLVDPGLGFGKRHDDNFALLRHLEALAAFGLPVLVGASRKAHVARAAAGGAAAKPLPVEQRLAASLGAAVAAYLHGAQVVRVHDVRATVEALRVAAAVRG